MRPTTVTTRTSQQASEKISPRMERASSFGERIRGLSDMQSPKKGTLRRANPPFPEGVKPPQPGSRVDCHSRQEGYVVQDHSGVGGGTEEQPVPRQPAVPVRE